MILFVFFFFSSRRRHTRCALVTGVQTCALPISELGAFRLFTGDPDQNADQLMASAEGAAQIPAHRGFSYVVFEDLQLADYGNRIPSLTFEVFAEIGRAHV